MPGEYDDLVAQSLQAQDAPEPATSPYDKLVSDSVQEKQSQREVLLRSAALTGVQQPPDNTAKALAYSEKLKLPLPVVQRNLEAVSKDVRLSEMDAASLIKSHPHLADWLSDPTNASLGQDDMPALRSIDASLRALSGQDPTGILPKGFHFDGGTIVESLPGGLGNTFNTLQDLRDELVRRNNSQAVQEIDRQENAQRYAQEYGPLTNIIAGAAGSLENTQRALGVVSPYVHGGDAIQEASQAISPGFWGDVQRGAGGLIADLPLMMSGGSLVTGLSALTKLGRARSLVESLAEATAKGRGAQGAARLQGERAAASKGVASAEADALLHEGKLKTGLEVALASQPLAVREGANTAEDNGLANGAMSWLIESVIPGAFGRTGVERYLVPGAEGVVADGWRGAVSRYLVDAGLEGAEESVTEFAHAVHEHASGINPDALEPDALWRRLAVAGTVGALAGGTFSLPTAIAEKFHLDAEEAHRAVNYHDRLQTAIDQLATSKVNERSPERVEALLEKHLGQTDRFTYFHPEEFRSAFKDPLAAAQAMGVESEYTESLATGAPLQIPTAKFMQRASVDEEVAKLVEHARRAPAAISGAQAAEFQDKAPDEIKRLTNEAKAQAAASKAQPADDREVLRGDIEKRLIRTGQDEVAAKTNATLMSNIFTSLGEKSGKKGSELYRTYLDGRIKKVLPALLRGEQFDIVDSMLERIRSGEVPSDEEIAADPKKQAIRASLDQLNGALVAAGVDPLSASNQEARAALATLMESEEAPSLGQPSGVMPKDQRLDMEAMLRQWRKATGDRTPVGGDRAFADLEDQARQVDEANGKSYAQPGKRARRGELAFGKDRDFTIKLFESENLSTFSHEGFHLTLEILGDLANEEGANAGLVEDYQKVKNWFKANKKEILSQAVDLARDAGLDRNKPAPGAPSWSQPITLLDSIRALTDEQIDAIADNFRNAPKDGTAAGFVHDAMHEYFARGGEAYLLEGKAPTPALRSVFARFRGWLTAIYRMVSTLKVNLSPEIRMVFDRLVSVEDAIDAAEERAGTQAILPPELFKDLPAYDAYRKAVQASNDAAKDRLAKELIADYRKEMMRAWDEQRGEIRTQIAGEVDAQPVYMVIAALQRGQLPDGTRLPDEYQGVKLDRAELVREWGEGILAKLPGPGERANSGSHVYAAEGGLSADIVAKSWGFSDGSDMIEAMIAAPDRHSLIGTETTKRMQNLHPDPLTDGSLPDKADQAMHGDLRGELLAREMRALGSKTGQTPAPTEVLRQVAQETISKTKARDLRPDRYRVAAAQAARKATEAAGKQDWATAYTEKQREALNLALYRASRDAVEESEAGRAYLRKFDTLAARQRLGKAGGWEFTVYDAEGDEVASYTDEKEARNVASQDEGRTYRRTNGYTEQIDAVLAGYDLRRVSTRSLRRRESFRAWIARQEADGEPVAIDPQVVDGLGNRNWNDLTVTEQQGVVDAVKNIDHLAGLKNKLLKAKRERDLDKARSEIVGTIVTYHPETIPQRFGDTLGEKVGDRIVKFLDDHRKDSFLARKMDGDKEGGPVWDYFIRSRNEAASDQETRNANEAQEFSKLFKEWGKKPGTAREQIPGTNLRLTLEQRIAMALNWGNAEGRQRVLMYLNRAGKTTNDAQAVIDSLDAADWKLINGIIHQINTHWSDVAALEQRTTGLRPEKVEALPFVTKNSTQPGGYYPIKYDASKSNKAGDLQAAADAKESLRAAGASAQTRRGHTKLRAANIDGLALRLDFGVAGEHLAEVVHDITHREMLIDQNRLLRDKEISGTIIAHQGRNALDQLVNTAADIATGDRPARTAAERFLRWTRQNSSAATFGWNLTSALMNVTGIMQSLTRVGPGRMAWAISRMTRDAAHLEHSGTWVESKSEFMRNRANTLLREVAEASRQVEVGGKLADARRWGYWPMVQVQRVVDTATWMAAYDQALEEQQKQGKSLTDAESVAVSLADQTVIDTQGSGRIGDLSAFQRGGEVSKLLTAFYSYFNVAANLQGSAISRVYNNPQDPGNWLKLGTTTLLVWTLPTLLGNLIRGFLAGDERDDKKRWEHMLREQASYGAGMLVGLREASGAIEGQYGYSGPAGARGLGALANVIGQIAELKADQRLLKAAINAGGILTGLPSTQANRVIDAVERFERDGDTGRALRTMLFGKPKSE